MIINKWIGKDRERKWLWLNRGTILTFA
jgi:hypothetical protein